MTEFDLTHEDREEIQCLLAEVELKPERLKILLAELVLNRRIVHWARSYRDRFPPALASVLHVLARRGRIEQAAADSHAEREPF
jgi:hypothetical protein